VVARIINHVIPPVTLNFARWVPAFFILLPLAHRVLRKGSGLWSQWRYFTMLGFLGVGCYNALQYLALQTSTPLNVTLVAGSLPMWMLALGWCFFGQKVSRRQLGGALLSMAGMLIVISHGEWSTLLHLHLVPGDLYMLLATISWAVYSWLLTQSKAPTDIRDDWAAMVMAQTVLGVGWAGLFAAAEWSLTDAHIVCSWPLAGTVMFISIGPGVLAYGCWGLGVQRAGPNMAGFFSNLTPLFAALMSAAFLGDWPQVYHALAFVLIVSGIVVASKH
jgi:drug/metabolite transporter (DMT)-like permease